jgi:hypothetical protein
VRVIEKVTVGKRGDGTLIRVEPLIATSPDITIMPPHDGEDMAPMKRLDETGDDDSVASAHPEHWTLRSDSRPRRVRVVDDALRSGSTAPERKGGRYLGIPQKRLQCPVRCHPEAQASSSRDSPNIETSEHSAALSDMGYEGKSGHSADQHKPTSVKDHCNLRGGAVGRF